MKSIFKLFLAFVLILSTTAAFAQSNGNNSKDEITLTVSAEGPTKDEAMMNALLKAIEQSYGSFVSKNTTMLNDESVKDEIVRVSNGAIKEYSEVSSYEKSDGSGFSVTATVTVSLPHLIKYAKNQGSECEFAGNTFGMQLKLWEIQKNNELEALEKLYSKIESIIHSQVSWELNMHEPKLIKGKEWDKWDGYVPEPVRLGNWAFEEDKKIEQRLIKRDEALKWVRALNPSDFCEVEFDLTFCLHPEYSNEEIAKIIYSNGGYRCSSLPHPIFSILKEDLMKIALTEEEAEAAEERNEDLGKTCIFNFEGNGWLRFRNNNDVIRLWEFKLSRLIQKVLFERLCIEDNLGVISDPYLLELITYTPMWEWAEYRGELASDIPEEYNQELYTILKKEYDELVRQKENEGKLYITCNGDDGFQVLIPNSTGLFKYPFKFKYPAFDKHSSYEYTSYFWTPFEYGESINSKERYRNTDTDTWDLVDVWTDFTVTFKILIPKDEIGKYSSFKVVRSKDFK